MPSAPHSPTVSVIIPNYNYAKTLRQCLQAVLDQTYPKIEIVVVDDGSTDDSTRIAAEFPCTLVRTGNEGPSAARNTGVARSTGEVLFFLDSDIALAPQAVERAVRMLGSDRRLGFVGGIYDKEPLIDDGPVERYKVLHGHFWRVRSSGEARLCNFSLGAMRRETYELAGPLDTGLRATEDVEYGARLSEISTVWIDATILGRHDDDDRLGVLLGKQYRRSVPLVALFADRGRARPKLTDTAYRPGAVAGTGLVLAGLAGAVLWPAAGAVTALAGAALFAVEERRLLKFLGAAAGARQFPLMAGLHLLMNATTGAAALVGAARWATSPSFRRLYANGERA
ncbi:glycosyltransferase [Actinosynnema pretiosum subsp. pretiosum]|uniref:Glycosyltransferase n=1 Tax=Actinosynnema pretiosum subsp. pretiosum TaxID=103721 RepID=A0AA45LBU6_9PSEU|nr:Beta-1,3-glucosyltransferase [Actinosynnema pretiosum subsp. pretiosum]QUF06713.1 glycosyltransferase [Actinosynnema pretiosum subsp. pretiosum]